MSRERNGTGKNITGGVFTGSTVTQYCPRGEVRARMRDQLPFGMLQSATLMF
jgi:hypothetical protein